MTPIHVPDHHPSAPPLHSPPPQPSFPPEETTVPPSMLVDNDNILRRSWTNQLYFPAGPSRLPSPWSSGLFDCCDDIGNCCITCLCPCITFGQIAEIVDGGSTPCGVSGALYAMALCVTGCACLYSCFYRSKMRGQYLLEESPCTDCIVHCCCESCALCQEYRELKARGFHLSLGWYGNLQMHNINAMVPPVVNGMIRR